MADFRDILLASDYDRTMTAMDGTIPASNLAAVEEFMAGGGAFTICTGRSLPMFRLQIEKLRVNAPVVLFNGAAVYDSASGETRVLTPLPDTFPQVCRRIQAMYPELRLELQGLRCHQCFGPDALRDAYLRKNGSEPQFITWDQLGDTVLSFGFFKPFLSAGHSFADEETPEDDQVFSTIARLIEEEYAGEYFAVRSMPRMIEMGPRGSGKGAAARWLANRLGRKILVCAGDAPNDLSMLEEADFPFIPDGCDRAMEGRGFRRAASCDEGMLASVIDQLRAL